MSSRWVSYGYSIRYHSKGFWSYRPQTETAKTETATNRKGHKPKRPQTETVCGRFGLWPFRFVAICNTYCDPLRGPHFLFFKTRRHNPIYMLYFYSNILVHDKHRRWCYNISRIFSQHWGREKNGRHFQMTFSNVFSWIKISLEFVLRGPINNTPALVQKIAWRRPGDKTLFEQMIGGLLTHICVIRPQWFKLNPVMIQCGTAICCVIVCVHWCAFARRDMAQLTHCGLVTPYSDSDLGQHWLR